MEVLVENLSSSIVREFLNKKKCEKTLQVLDGEWPRPESSISSRAKLAQALHIESWVNKNKASPTPLKTMLEVILQNIIQLRTTQSNLLASPALDGSLNKTVSNLPTKDNVSIKVHATDSRPFTANAALNSGYNNSSKSAPNTSRPNERNLTIDTLDDIDINELLLDSSPVIKKQPPTTYDFSFDRDKSKRSLSRNSESDAGSDFLRPSSAATRYPTETATIEDMLLDITDEFGEKQTTEALRISSQKFITNNSQQRYLSVNQHSGSNRSSRSTSANTQPEISANEKFGYEIAKKLRMLMFGTAKYAFSSEWCDQNFAFFDGIDRPKELRFGIIQKKGGPCGVLAAVQGTVLKHMLFSSEAVTLSESNLNVSDAYRSACLVEAVTEMLWRAGESRQATLATMSLRRQFNGVPMEYRPDGITEYVVTISCSSKSELQTAVKQHIAGLEQGKGSCILLLYSAILSRGIRQVKSDMDDPKGKLMGAHNYCTQEMINLLLIGRATSNAFNDTVVLDEHTTLKGVHAQSEVGMLSLFEHYGSCKIGDNYKTPKYPVWLVCSESHFTVLFGLDMKMASKFQSPLVFDLYYFDGLANQDELIRLTIDTSIGVCDGDQISDLIPPLEHCIRTKWPRAYIGWNDTEPLL